MVNSKSGGKNVSVSDLSALRPPKHVTSSTLQQAKKSALASKTQMLSVRALSGPYVVKVSAGTPTGTARTLSRDELNSLRETKRLVASRVRQELAPSWSSLAELPKVDADLLQERQSVISDEGRFNL